jgi:5-hydroxyisourate hydrolase-like protein (transthyretin family)
MTFQSVTLYILDKQLGTPIPGVVVRVFNPEGTTYIQQQTSDADGKIALLLPDDTKYQLRMYKFQVSFENPVYLTTPACDETNLDAAFEVYGTPFRAPQSTDPDMCRVSGFFRTPTGARAANVNISFITQFKPMLLGSAAVLTERVECRTNKDGYVELDLMRCACFDVGVEGIEGVFRTIQVPDLPSANLPDLLFPYIARVEFSPAPPWDVPAGGFIRIDAVAYRSDGAPTENISEHLTWYTDDQSLVRVAVGANQITLESPSNTTGTTQLQARPDDLGIVVLPVPVLAGLPATVRVV